MGMSISSSGRHLDELYLSPKMVTAASSCVSRAYNPHAISREKVIEMLKLENEYRLSPKWIALMEEESQNLEYPMTTIDALQREVARQSGFETEKDIVNAVEHIRSAIALFGRSMDILNAANYLKFNRMKRFPSRRMMSSIVDVQLHEGLLSEILDKPNDIKFHLLISVSVT